MADSKPSLDSFPTELLLQIFQYLSATELAINRRVSQRWKSIIDDIISQTTYSKGICAKHFPQIYEQAMYRTPYCKTWFDLFKSLYLWKKINTANITISDFTRSTTVADENRSIMVLENGLICVHRRTNIIYWNLVTQQISSARSFNEGEFYRVYEVDDIIIKFGKSLLILKWIGPLEKNYNMTLLLYSYDAAKIFMVHEKHVYIASIDNRVVRVGLFNSDDVKDYPGTLDSSVVGMSIYNNKLHVITTNRTISAFVNNRFEFQFLLGSLPNIVHTLWQYNLLENIDWRTIYIWMAQTGENVPRGYMRSICTIRVYGDLFLVGTHCGLLSIFYKPFIDGELSIFDVPPVREIQLHQIKRPLSILKIEVIENVNSHVILVAMSRKIVLLEINHP